MYIIYCSTNQINYKSYIGQTSNFEERKKSHIRNSIKNYKNKCKNAFQKALYKYGVENFNWEIICECSSVEEANEMEEYYILFLNTLSPNGYNLKSGGKNHLMSKEVREKIKEKLKIVGTFIGKKGKDHPNFGKKLSKERKQQLSFIKSGENGSNTKLTKEQVIEIYNFGLNGLNAAQIGKYLLLNNVFVPAKNTILNILNKQSWKEVLKNLPKINVKCCGEKWFKSKLTESQVVEILTEYKSKQISDNNFYNEYAKKFDVKSHCIYSIVKKINWKHITI